MCGNGSGGDGGAAAAAAAEQKRRQAIEQGTAAIDRVFGGYSRGVNPVNAVTDRGATYYLDDGTPVQVVQQQVENPAYLDYLRQQAEAKAQPKNSATRGYNLLAARKAQAAAKNPPASTIGKDFLYSNGKQVAAFGEKPIFTGVENVAGFDDNFYRGLEDKYTANAMPQLEDQYAEARRQMLYALERKGLTASTAAGDAQKRMETQYNKYRTDIGSAAKGYSQNARADIEAARSSLLNQLVATENPAMAGEGALRAAAARSAPPAFDPVGQFVFDISEGLKAESARNGYRPAFSPALFQSGRGSSSISYRD